MLESPKKGMIVWFKHGDKTMSGTVLSDQTIDGFYSVAVVSGIPKLLLPTELFDSQEDVV